MDARLSSAMTIEKARTEWLLQELELLSKLDAQAQWMQYVAAIDVLASDLQQEEIYIERLKRLLVSQDSEFSECVDNLRFSHQSNLKACKVHSALLIQEAQTAMQTARAEAAVALARFQSLSVDAEAAVSALTTLRAEHANLLVLEQLEPKLRTALRNTEEKLAAETEAKSAFLEQLHRSSTAVGALKTELVKLDDEHEATLEALQAETMARWQAQHSNDQYTEMMRLMRNEADVAAMRSSEASAAANAALRAAAEAAVETVKTQAARRAATLQAAVRARIEALERELASSLDRETQLLAERSMFTPEASESWAERAANAPASSVSDVEAEETAIAAVQAVSDAAEATIAQIRAEHAFALEAASADSERWKAKAAELEEAKHAAEEEVENLKADHQMALEIVRAEADRRIIAVEMNASRALVVGGDCRRLSEAAGTPNGSQGVSNEHLRSDGAIADLGRAIARDELESDAIVGGLEEETVRRLQALYMAAMESATVEAEIGTDGADVDAQDGLTSPASSTTPSLLLAPAFQEKDETVSVLEAGAEGPVLLQSERRLAHSASDVAEVRRAAALVEEAVRQVNLVLSQVLTRAKDDVETARCIAMEREVQLKDVLAAAEAETARLNMEHAAALKAALDAESANKVEGEPQLPEKTHNAVDELLQQLRSDHESEMRAFKTQAEAQVERARAEVARAGGEVLEVRTQLLRSEELRVECGRTVLHCEKRLQEAELECARLKESHKSEMEKKVDEFERERTGFLAALEALQSVAAAEAAMTEMRDDHALQAFASAHPRDNLEEMQSMARELSKVFDDTAAEGSNLSTQLERLHRALRKAAKRSRRAH
eukprot:3406679-Pleurochrysis_carterae.AAC.1